MVPGIVETELLGGPRESRVVGVGDRVQVRGLETGLREAPARRQLRQLPGGERHRAVAVLSPGEALLLSGCHHPTVDDERDRGVVEQRVDAEHAHGAPPRVGCPLVTVRAAGQTASPVRSGSTTARGYEGIGCSRAGYHGLREGPALARARVVDNLVRA